MRKMQGYNRCAAADNVSIFHGREIRQVTRVLVCFDVLSCNFATFMTLCKVASAAGGMGFVLHLSLANGADSEGWSQQEIAEYDGWGHDSSRHWRKAPQLHKERAAIPSTKLQLAVTHFSRKAFPTSQPSLVRQRASFSSPPVDVKGYFALNPVTQVHSSPPLLLPHRRGSKTLASGGGISHPQRHTQRHTPYITTLKDGCEGVGPVLQQG